MRSLSNHEVRMTVSGSHSRSNPRIPRAVLFRMKNAILGSPYDLSIATVTPAVMRRLNRKYRGQNKPTDILSFPLSKLSGEIIFCMSEVRRQAPVFGRSPDNFLTFLLIHGLLHLKGYAHGSRMEKLEAKFGKQFGV